VWRANALAISKNQYGVTAITMRHREWRDLLIREQDAEEAAAHASRFHHNAKTTRPKRR